MTLHYIQALELRTGVKRRQVETPCPFAQLIKVQQFLNLGIVFAFTTLYFTQTDIMQK